MERGYPKREHLKTPKNAFDVISGELRLYPDGDSFREALVGLNRIYRDTNYAISLQEHAIKAASAHVLVNSTDYALGTSQNVLYAGSIFGLHAQLVPVSQSLRRSVVDANFSVSLDPHENETTESFSARDAAQYINYSELIGSGSESLHEHQQLLLMTAAERACQGYGNHYENLFIEGMLTSLHGVQSAIHHYRRHGS